MIFRLIQNQRPLLLRQNDRQGDRALLAGGQGINALLDGTIPQPEINAVLETDRRKSLQHIPAVEALDQSLRTIPRDASDAMVRTKLLPSPMTQLVRTM